MKLILLTAAIYFACASGEQVKFDNYAVYRFTPKNENELSILQTLQKLNKYDFWTEPRRCGLPVDVMVPPQSKHYMEKLISEHELTFEIMIENVQKRIDQETSLNLKKSKVGFGWKKYNTLDEIYDWLKELAAEYPDYVTLVKGGSTYEGRDILGVKISFNPGNENKTVWIDSLIHAREWIAGATSTYILNKILTSTDLTVRQVAESHDWLFFPVINPDGYEYTHTTNRMWRKTRKPYGKCFGTDPNRNWDYRWNQGGSTDDPCDETYAGPYAFSDVETSTLSQYMSGVAKDLILFITFHSYSQFILIPYGHTTEHLDNYNVTKKVGEHAADVLYERYETNYIVGNIAETIYVATGANMDWVKANYHVPFAYAYELRDTGKYGFLLPPSQIVPTGQETLDSIVTILQDAAKLSI